MGTSGKDIVRVLAAVAVLLGGIWHYQIWDKTYRGLPDQIPGVWVVKQGFPINAASSVLLAALLVATAAGVLSRLRMVVALGALALEASSIVVLVLTRGRGFFRWQEKGDWGHDPKRVLAVESIAVVLLLITLAFDTSDRSAAGRQ
ncbi:MAG: hypothetical protein JWM05_3090 [Acidimicrobiales bacterium]|nr:hypothetical protein [Acidimicrobiales bacterium]